MREVKFRAKVLNTNNWIYRQPFHIRGTWYMYNSLWDMVPIEHKTIGQYTGLKDKNGVEIYEGDIIECQTFDEKINEKQIGTIGYNEGRHGFVFTPTWMEPKNLYYPLFAVITCEVIGSIFEHSHLLEGAQ